MTDSNAAVDATLQGFRSLGQVLPRLLREPELVGQTKVLRPQSMKGSQVPLRVNGHDLTALTTVANALVGVPRTDSTARTTRAGDLNGDAHDRTRPEASRDQQSHKRDVPTPTPHGVGTHRAA